MGTKSRDEGSVHVLEAMIVATIMLSAIVFVVTYDQPVTTEGNARGGLAQSADDALAILYETPVESPFGDDALSAYIAECLNKMCDSLTRQLDKLVPDGGAYALYVSNGYDTYPVYVMGEPRGEAVAASQAFEPQWSSTFVSTATDLVGVGDALLTYELPVFNSNVVTPGGSHLLVKMEGSRRDGSDFVMIGSYSTVARPASDDAAIAASLYFVDDAGNPMAVHEPEDAELQEREVLLRLEESRGGEIPAGVEVAVELPRGWIGRAEAPDNDGWDILENATDKNGAYAGSAIRATLNESLVNDHLDLRLTLTYQGDVLDFYPVHARLSRGALASATLLIRGEDHGAAPTLATPLMGMSVPSPMGNSDGDPTTWTIYAYAPFDDSGFGGQAQMSGALNVRQIEIRELDGNAIFGDVEPIEAMDGEWQSYGDRIVWYGDQELTYENFLNLTFRVEASGVAGPSEARAAFVPPVTFDDFTGKLVERSGWGFHRQAFLPATAEYAGFNGAVAADGWKTEHDAVADAVYRSTSLPGASTYNATVLGSIEDALYGAYVAAQDRTVPVGGEVVIDANVQSLLFKLAEAGQRAGVTLRFYPPWSGDARVPIFEQENLDQGLLSAEVTQVAAADLNGDSYPDPIVGTTNGRVIAYSGLNGQRMQGNTFTAPVTAAAASANTLPRINALTTMTLGGEPYIVVGTDKNSDGLFVLDASLELAWYWQFTGADVLALDASTSFDGDAEPEIVVARSVDVGASKNSLTYVFRANARTPQQIEDGIPALLEPLPASTRVAEDSDALYYSLGTPTMLAAQERLGPYGNTPGVLVPTQTLLDPGLTINQDVFPPTVQRGALSTPRAGLLGIDEGGVARATLFGAPASVVRTYDHEPVGPTPRDDVDDVLMGGSSGYVILANGSVLTQPLYSYLIVPTTMIIDADSLSSDESYVLTDEGLVLMTDDAWITNWGPDDPAVGGNAIAANEPNNFWVVGSLNQMWKSMPGIEPPIASRAHMPPFTELTPPFTPTIVDDPTFFVGRLYEFNDIWFRGDEGYVVSSRCIGVCAASSVILHTTDGGDTWSATEGPEADLHAVDVIGDTAWIVGAEGTILRKLDGETEWTELDSGIGKDLNDIDCRPNDRAWCIAVGDEGTAIIITDALGGAPSFLDVSQANGLPEDKRLFTVGYQTSERVYIGSENAIYASFDGASWTELPMNYLPNDVRAINALGDGSGFVYGGKANSATRIWLLHDYHTQSQAQTIALGNALALPANALITSVSIAETDISLGGQEVAVNVATNGNNWYRMDPLAVSTDLPTDDPRQAHAQTATFVGASSGRDLRFNFTMNTTGDKTIVSPHLRMMSFDVAYTSGGVPATTTVTIDFTDDSWKDATRTTADWNTTMGALRQRLVSEFWTREVNGEVLDMQTGYDIDGSDDGREEVWVATGNIIAENSPDHSIYAADPDDPSEVVGRDDRVYLLNGANGDILATSDQLAGAVRAIRAVDEAPQDGMPDALYAIAFDGAQGYIYDLDPFTLDFVPADVIELAGESPVDIEMGHLQDSRAVAFIGTQRASAEVDALGHLWALDTQTGNPIWRAIPDEMGKYEIEATVEPGWLFGPYVVEVEVEWEEATTDSELPSEVVRSARFYDHFLVTPPDVLSAPTPVYTARLLVWMQDWG